jgi:hypothetical protein
MIMPKNIEMVGITKFLYLLPNITFYAATVFSGILTEGREYIKGKTGSWEGFTP